MLKALNSNRLFLLVGIFVVSLGFVFCQLLYPGSIQANTSSDSRPIVLISINGTINPATADFLKTSLTTAKEKNARLFILQLNTPGGLLPSMQSMVEALLESTVPSVVYVTPSGGSAMSAGVFITLAGNFAVMSPGTTIGAAHPVLGGGGDITGDMREKIENSSVSLIRAIAEQRGRNTKWAEDAVRESVAITDREAVTEKVIDFVASDLQALLSELEGKTVSVKGVPQTLIGLADAPRQYVEMSFKQEVVNILADPNLAYILGIAAVVGIGLELYHPGAAVPGIVGVICLVLSLIAGQVLPINYGGLALLLLGAVFFAVEMFMPAFGIWGAAGILCLVLGGIYFVDTEAVWSSDSFGVHKGVTLAFAGCAGALLFLVGSLVARTSRLRVSTGGEGLVGQECIVVKDFETSVGGDEILGRVRVNGELWNACLSSEVQELPKVGQKLLVSKLMPQMTLLVKFK